MDPQATWNMLVDTLRDLHATPDDQELRTIACTLLESLASWIRRGGYPPTVE